MIDEWIESDNDLWTETDDFIWIPNALGSGIYVARKVAWEFVAKKVPWIFVAKKTT